MTDAECAQFTGLPDLASRALGGSVAYANDEFFAEKENLIRPGPPEFAAGAFGHKGKVYDGWETRRRRDAGHDHAIVRLGCPGVVHGVVVDTAFFRGNYPPEISLEAACADGHPDPAELAALPWHVLVPRSAARGDAENPYPVADPRRWTHVRLSIYPDGGVARLRVHGDVVPDPAFMTGTIDLAALENGGLVTGCSDAFYSSPANLIMPGLPRVMSDGWENARRRGPGNDWVEFRLAAAGRLRRAEIDTSYFVGNAPGWVALSVPGAPGTERDGRGERPGSAEPGTGGEPAASALAGNGGEPGASAGPRESAGQDGPGEPTGPEGPGERAWREASGERAWHEGPEERARAEGPEGPGERAGPEGPGARGWRPVLARTRVQPDTRHRFALDDPAEVTRLRLDVYPDGGLARLRIYGELTPSGLAAVERRWRETAP